MDDFLAKFRMTNFGPRNNLERSEYLHEGFARFKEFEEGSKTE